MPPTSEIHRIAFLGDYLPRKCGIATFTSDLLAAVAAEHPQSECFAVPVNDREGGYDYPDVVRFEVEEQDLSSWTATPRPRSASRSRSTAGIATACSRTCRERSPRRASTSSR